MSEPFIAEIKIFAGNFAPRNYAFCDGQLLPISQHTALFSLVGTTYGGDGRTTFALPNLQGRAPMHPGTGPGLSPRRLGEIGGVEMARVDEAQMPSHSHPLLGVPSADQAGPDGSPALGAGPIYARQGPLVGLATEAIGDIGGSLPHNNMQPYLAMNFIIALEGLYPARN